MKAKVPTMKNWSCLLTLLLSAACSSAAPPETGVTLAAGAGKVGSGSVGAIAAANAAAARYTRADVEFMAGMIPHHAQAVVMCSWADSHGARADVRLLCEKIRVAQRDEIRMMRGWLAERGEVVPDSMATRHVMRMGDTTHEMLMPGMLTDDEMAALDAARGSRFDRLFLTGMIRHHQGAINMVTTLNETPDAGLEDVVFRFSSDVVADQSGEIQRMLLMLETVPPPSLP